MDQMKKLFSLKGKLKRAPKKKESSVPLRQNLAGKIESGQATRASILGSYGGGSGFVSKREYIFDMDVDALRLYPTTTLLKNLHYLNPDASMAIWTLLRLCASGWSLKCSNLDGSENIEGYEYLMNEVIANVNRERGGFDAFLDSLHKTTLVLGASSCETILAPDLRTILDIVPVDPATLEFKSELMTDGQERYVAYQQQMTGMKKIEKAGFYYVPLDVDIGNPIGVSPIVSMLQIIFFQMQMMDDLQRVTHNQAWPRLDVSILEEVIRANAPRNILANPKKLVEFMDSQMALIKGEYANIDPDDAFIHTDAVKVDIKEPSQALGSNARAIMDTVDKNLANAMHILTIFINKHRGITETYGSVQWKIQVKTVESFQKCASRIVNDALTFALNLRGIQGNATLVYDPIPTESPFQQEEAELMKAKRVTFIRDAGYINHDTAASMLIDAETAEGEEVAMFGASGGEAVEGGGDAGGTGTTGGIEEAKGLLLRNGYVLHKKPRP